MSRSSLNKCVNLDSLNTCPDQQVKKTKTVVNTSCDALSAGYYLAASVPDELDKIYNTVNKRTLNDTTEDNNKINPETIGIKTLYNINDVHRIKSETGNPAYACGLVERFQNSSVYYEGTSTTEKFCSLNAAVLPTSENLSCCVNSVGAYETNPKNPTETLQLVKNNFWKTISDLYNSDPGMTFAMLGSISWIVFAGGLKYVHYQNQKSNENMNKFIEKNNENQNILVKEKMSELSALTKEDNVKQDKRVDDIITRLEKDVDNRFSRCEDSIKEAKLLQMQQSLLVQTNENFKKIFREEKLKGSKSDEEIIIEQEMALRAAMERHSERMSAQLPKSFYYQFQQLQNATTNYALCLDNEHKKMKEFSNLNEIKSNNEIDKVMTTLEAETKGYGDLLKVMEPQLKFLGRRIRWFRPK